MSDVAVTTRSYLSGEWYAVLGPGLVLGLPPDRRELAAAAWALVDAGADADEVLDTVLREGLADLVGFVLVSTEGDRTRAVVRGPAACLLDAGGEERMADGRTASTWVEVGVDRVTAVSIELGEGARGPVLEAREGLVRASRIVWPAECAGRGTPGAGPGTPVAEQRPASTPIAPPVALPDDPTDGSPTEPPAGPPPAPAWVPASGDHDGQTRDGSWPTEQFARPAAGIPGQPPAPEVTADPVAVLELSTGEHVEVDRVVVVGRAPEARRFTATEHPRLLTVPSPQQEISSTHLEVRPGTGADHGSAVATDLGSTNGTILLQPGLPPESLRPGIGVSLLPGAVLDLGDGLSITVVQP